MLRVVVLALMLTTPKAAPAQDISLPFPPEPRSHSLLVELEGASFSYSTGFSSEFPEASGFRHQGQVEAEDTGFGLGVEFRPGSLFGVRLGYLRTSFQIEGEHACTQEPVCTVMFGFDIVSTTPRVLSVGGRHSGRLVTLEFPVRFQPRGNLELFGGPMLVSLSVGGSVESPGVIDGLRVRARSETQTWGLHLGGRAFWGDQRRWSTGLTARWMRADFELTVEQPFLARVIGPVRGKSDATLVTVGLVAGWHFGPR